jgi:murein DD-endopeptidase MepM/ murein hydrolase activator NlpD
MKRATLHRRRCLPSRQYSLSIGRERAPRVGGRHSALDSAGRARGADHHDTSAVPSATVRAFGKDLIPFRESPTEWRVLVGIDIGVAPGRHDVTIETGPAEADRVTKTLTVSPKSFATRKLTVDEEIVNPPEAALARIKADAERLNRVWSATEPKRLWNGPFVRPVAEAANSAFGSRSVFNGEARNPHSGADFLSPSGTPVKAPNAGRVALAADLYFTGNTVVIDHGLGLFSLFAHLRSMAVQEGSLVKTGDEVGEVGATGRVTGPHLHWSVRLNDARVDPLSLLAILGAR